MRHGEVENQVTAPSGVLQVVEDLNVTAFLPILGAGGDTMLRPNPVTAVRNSGPRRPTIQSWALVAPE